MRDFRTLEQIIRQVITRKLNEADTEFQAARDMKVAASAEQKKRKYKVVHKKTGKVRGVHDTAQDAVAHHVALKDKEEHKVVITNEQTQETFDLVEGWMKHKDGTYSADMSDVGAHFRSGKQLHCPKCRSTKLASERVKDKEGEVTHHDVTCKECKTKMKIFNDSVDHDAESMIAELAASPAGMISAPNTKEKKEKKPEKKKKLTDNEKNQLEQEKQHMQAHASDQNEETVTEDHYEVGSHVTVKIGPHKGERHKVIHDHGDGTYNLAYAGKKPAAQVKYSLGAVRAKVDLIKKIDEARFDDTDFSDREKFEKQRKSRLAIWKKTTKKKEMVGNSKEKNQVVVNPKEVKETTGVDESYRTRSADSKVVLQYGIASGKPFWKKERARYIKVGENPVGNNKDEKLPSSLSKPGKAPEKSQAKVEVKEPKKVPATIAKEEVSTFIDILTEEELNFLLETGVVKEPYWKTWTYLYHRQGKKYKALDPSIQPHVNALHKKLRAADRAGNALEKNPSKIKECFENYTEFFEDELLNEEENLFNQFHKKLKQKGYSHTSFKYSLRSQALSHKMDRKRVKPLPEDTLKEGASARKAKKVINRLTKSANSFGKEQGSKGGLTIKGKPLGKYYQDAKKKSGWDTVKEGWGALEQKRSSYRHKLAWEDLKKDHGKEHGQELDKLHSKLWSAREAAKKIGVPHEKYHHINYWDKAQKDIKY